MKRHNNRPPHGYGGLVLLVAAGTFAPVYGQGGNADPLNVDLARCVDLKSDDERFACYQKSVDDALAGRGSSAPAETPQPQAGGGAVPEQRATAPTAAPASSTATTAEIEIFATITHLRETVPDLWIITLDNGQVWQMNRAQQYPLRVGLEVRLRSTPWGESYRLTAPEHGGFVQVRRAL